MIPSISIGVLKPVIDLKLFFYLSVEVSKHTSALVVLIINLVCLLPYKHALRSEFILVAFEEVSVFMILEKCVSTLVIFLHLNNFFLFLSV